ncbi:hypothetical protein AALA24_12355, partial [Anaerovoracaceae bacterium 42-11]
KNDPVMTEEGNNTIVKEGQGQPGENLGGDTMIEPDWNRVATVKKNYPDMLIPGYVPEGYEFKELQVEVTEAFSSFTYIYQEGDKLVKIVQLKGEGMKVIKNYDYTFETGDGIEVSLKDDEEKSANFFIGSDLCVIVGNLSDMEIGKIVDSLER